MHSNSITHHSSHRKRRLWTTETVIITRSWIHHELLTEFNWHNGQDFLVASHWTIHSTSIQQLSDVYRDKDGRRNRFAKYRLTWNVSRSPLCYWHWYRFATWHTCHISCLVILVNRVFSPLITLMISTPFKVSISKPAVWSSDTNLSFHGCSA